MRPFKVKSKRKKKLCELRLKAYNIIPSVSVDPAISVTNKYVGPKRWVIVTVINKIRQKN